MTLGNPIAFYLLLAALLILVLHFLQARERQRDVSALFLWEGLSGDPQSRAAQIRQQIDPLLLLQLAALTALVFALAQPAWRIRTASLSGLAIVLDGSASMQALMEDGSTRYESALREAESLLEEFSSTTTAVIQLSSAPKILGRPGLDPSDLRDAVRRSQPTWYGDGTTESLLSLLGSIGGASRFERVVVLSDHPFPKMPASFETVLVDSGDNLALTGFSVRANPDGEGVTAFVTVLNDSDDYRDVTIRIDDRENQTSLALLMPPASHERFVVPFPHSRGSLFTAMLEPDDRFGADNRRFFALDRPIDIRIHWIGLENRYLMAALRAVAPVTLVDAPVSADLTIVHAVRAPVTVTGTVLLVHGGIEGVLTLGAAQPIDRIEIRDPDHPLLNGVDPTTFRIREAPYAWLPPASEIVLASGDLPLLATYTDETRTLFYLAPNILGTNLPITIDFPLLIRNIVAGLVRLPSELSYRSAEVGEPIPLGGRGTVNRLYDANEEAIPLPEGLLTVRPVSPGFHTLITDRGAFPIAVNIPSGESVLSSPSETVEAAARETRRTVRLLPLWQGLAALGIVLLFAETYLHATRQTLARRSR